MTDLTEGEGYYVRGYAANEIGIAYTNEVYFVPTGVFIIESLHLMVQTSDMPLGTYDWNAANSACSRSTIGGYTDWRLPTEEELAELCARKFEIGGFRQDTYWASTKRDDITSDFHQLVNFSEEEDCFQGWARDDYAYRVRAVRTIRE